MVSQPVNLFPVYLLSPQLLSPTQRRTQYCSGYQIEKNEVGGACITCLGEEMYIQGFGGET